MNIGITLCQAVTVCVCKRAKLRTTSQSISKIVHKTRNNFIET